MYRCAMFYKGEQIAVGYGNAKNIEDAEMRAGFAFVCKYGVDRLYDRIEVSEIDENSVIQL